MPLIVPEESQRPYRFGMTLVCIGALFNWLGLADHHTKPVPAVRYIGVGLVASGAVLICMAMCFWINSVRDDEDDESIDQVHVISVDPPVRLDEKPPDYASVVDVPPSYDDAIKLDPQRLVMVVEAAGNPATTDTCAVTVVADECDKSGGGPPAVPVPGAAIPSPVGQPTLAQAIRKSIRDIRKQLTNTVVSDTTSPADPCDQQQQQQQQQQSQSDSQRDGPVKPNAQTAAD